MPMTTYKSFTPNPPIDPEVNELLIEIVTATKDEGWYIEECVEKSYSYKGPLLRRTVIKTSTFELLHHLMVNEYQIINGVSTKREVMAFMYGIFAGLQNVNKNNEEN